MLRSGAICLDDDETPSFFKKFINDEDFLVVFRQCNSQEIKKIRISHSADSQGKCIEIN